MRLTGGRHAVRHASTGPTLTTTWAAVSVVGTLLAAFELDHWTGSAPVQHLYYVPIILASLRFGRGVGSSVSLAAVLLYHLANPAIKASGYRETDVVQIALFVLVGLVATRLSEDARRLRELAMTDDLTGLHNLRSFEARLIDMVRAAGLVGTPLSMLVVDVDHLKLINDRHGHLAGAEAVRAVGHMLAARLPAAAVACRYGGDEFAIAIATCAESQAAFIADSLRRAVHDVAPVLEGKRFPPHTLSISIGVACSNPHGERTTLSRDEVIRAGEELFRAADQALYVAKARGRNRVGTSPLSGINPQLTAN